VTAPLSRMLIIGPAHNRAISIRQAVGVEMGHNKDTLAQRLDTLASNLMFCELLS
jgi:hypothetical protein